MIKKQDGGFSLPKNLRIAGIIAEYNPFHYGHAWQIKEAKKKINPDLTIIILGGNYTQRGEMSVLRRADKVNLALNFGADLVVGIPFYNNIQAVKEFALGSVKVAQQVGVTDLVFGTEIPEFHYQEQAHRYFMSNSAKNPKISLKNANFASNIAQNFAKFDISINQSNHLLALYYAIAAEELNFKINFIPLKRLTTSGISSHKIRKLLKENRYKDLVNLVPSETLSAIIPDAVKKFENTFKLVKSRLLLNDYNKYSSFFLFNQELFYRFHRAIEVSNSYEEFIHIVKTKRYTLTRIKRNYLYLLLEITKEQVMNSNSIEVWGFNKKGQKYLSTIKKKVNLITNLQKSVYRYNKVLYDEYHFNRFYDYIMDTSPSKIVIKR